MTLVPRCRPARRRASILVALASLVALLVAPAAGATIATIVVSGGSLSFINGTPSNIVFSPVTENGTSATTSGSLAFDVSDATGSQAGWRILAVGTAFSNGSSTLPTNAVQVPATPSASCDSGSACTLASPTTPYPYVMPEGTDGSSLPVATSMFNARTGTGVGNETVTAMFSVTIPLTSSPGSYTATWFFSLVSGP